VIMRAVMGPCDGCGRRSERLSFHADPVFPSGKYFCQGCMMLGAFMGPYHRASAAVLAAVDSAGRMPPWLSPFFWFWAGVCAATVAFEVIARWPIH
jgi:hypothetical protein